MAAALGQLDIADLEVDDREQLRRELGRAITELAVAAGRPHLVATGDPLVVQLRALGRLALVAPGATSAAAGRILAAGSSASA